MMDNNKTYGELLHALDLQTRHEYKTLEKIKNKIICREYAGLYNDVCFNEELLPNDSKQKLEL